MSESRILLTALKQTWAFHAYASIPCLQMSGKVITKIYSERMEVLLHGIPTSSSVIRSPVVFDYIRSLEMYNSIQNLEKLEKP